MKIKCAYHACRKEVEQENAVKSTLIYNHGGRVAKQEREYCSKDCANHDQYAHEG
ncbi:YdaE family protein [Trabulsiella odontotermitis]|uniref:YdaE family protein n=1 Tax=Trabulsiella odontotermitis TaxID=379893 RepID=UPI003ACE0682